MYIIKSFDILNIRHKNIVQQKEMFQDCIYYSPFNICSCYLLSNGAYQSHKNCLVIGPLADKCMLNTIQRILFTTKT